MSRLLSELTQRRRWLDPDLKSKAQQDAHGAEGWGGSRPELYGSKQFPDDQRLKFKMNLADLTHFSC